MVAQIQALAEGHQASIYAFEMRLGAQTDDVSASFDDMRGHLVAFICG